MKQESRQNWEPLVERVFAELERRHLDRRRSRKRWVMAILLCLLLAPMSVRIEPPPPEYSQPVMEQHFDDGSVFVLFLLEEEAR